MKIADVGYRAEYGALTQLTFSIHEINPADSMLILDALVSVVGKMECDNGVYRHCCWGIAPLGKQSLEYVPNGAERSAEIVCYRMSSKKISKLVRSLRKAGAELAESARKELMCLATVYPKLASAVQNSGAKPK